jgi:cytochrome bd-type quinol oxidase subunit 1
MAFRHRAMSIRARKSRSLWLAAAVVLGFAASLLTSVARAAGRRPWRVSVSTC